MARPARHLGEGACTYHVTNRCVGYPSEFPFKDPVVASQFCAFFEFYLKLYFCTISAFQLMGNHFHAILHFEAYRRLERSELLRLASDRWGPRWKLVTAGWGDADWEKFNRKLFTLDGFMQHVQGEFSKWYNKHQGRRGHFWAERYKSTLLLDLQAVQNTILYVELNGVRANLAERPEEYKLGSAYWRHEEKTSELLVPLEKLFPANKNYDSFTSYRSRLYLRGAVATKDNHAVIPEAIIREEEARGFKCPGAFKRRLRCFSDGIALGASEQVGKVLERYRESGRYKRRRNPIPQLGGLLFSLREQRSNAFDPD